MLIDDLTLLAFTASLGVLLAHTDTLNKYHTRLREGLYHLAGLPLLGTREDNNRITFLYMECVHKNFFCLHNLRRARNNGLEAEVLELARDRAEDAAGLRLLLVFAARLEDHHRVLIEADI